MPDPTRDCAFDLLVSVLDRHRPLEEALDTLPPMEARDRAAGHRLAAAVLRRTGTLDAVLEPFLRRAPPVPVRHILRIGAAGLLLLDTPPHAAVATSVGLARRARACAFRRAGERRAAAGRGRGPASLRDLDGPRLDTPAWLWSAWGDGGAPHRRGASDRGAARPHLAGRRGAAPGWRSCCRRVPSASRRARA